MVVMSETGQLTYVQNKICKSPAVRGILTHRKEKYQDLSILKRRIFQGL